MFAAFAVRVGLEIGVGEASERLAMEAVRSHMRILEAVVDSMVITTSPPEPMLAIAAAMAMNHSEETYKTALGTLLDKLILKGIVLDRGLLGELSSRLLFLRARPSLLLGIATREERDGDRCTLIEFVVTQMRLSRSTGLLLER